MLVVRRLNKSGDRSESAFNFIEACQNLAVLLFCDCNFMQLPTDDMWVNPLFQHWNSHLFCFPYCSAAVQYLNLDETVLYVLHHNECCPEHGYVIPWNPQYHEVCLGIPILNLKGEVDASQAELTERFLYFCSQEFYELPFCEILVGCKKLAEEVSVFESHHK